jgi:hypothetical protein
MSVRNRRLAIAGVITAAAIAVPPAAYAAGSGSPSGKPSPPQTCATSACKSKASHSADGKSAAGKSAVPSQLPALAASAGISTDRLQAGLAAAKGAGGNTAAGIAAFAASTGVSQATAQRIVHAVFGPQIEGKTPGSAAGEPSFAPALASQLGVSISAAERAVNQLQALGRGGIGPGSPAFAAIARDLGVTSARLAAALGAAKQSLAGK